MKCSYLSVVVVGIPMQVEFCQQALEKGHDPKQTRAWHAADLERHGLPKATLSLPSPPPLSETNMQTTYIVANNPSHGVPGW